MQSPLTCALVLISTLLSICNSQTFTWISGDQGVAGSASWGTKGVGSPNNRPPPKGEVFTWIDDSNALWLFGGISAGRNTHWSDLWKFKDGNWTWISGPSTPNEVGNYGQKGIASPSNEPPSRSTGASWKTNDGAFWLYGGSSIYGKYSDVWKFDGVYWTWVAGSNETNIPASYVSKGTPDPNAHPGADRYYFSNWGDSFGNLWIFGGLIESTNPFDSLWLSDLWMFNVSSEVWTWVSGSSETNLNATWGTQGIPNVNNIPESRYGAVTWVDQFDNLWMFGGSGVGFTRLSSLWKFDGSAWTWVSGSQFADLSGTYGTIRVPNINNYPGARLGAVVAKDLQDNIWMFGGFGIDAFGGYGALNDLWRFNGTVWTWMRGSDSAWNGGNYGTIGIPSAGTFPPGRNPAGAWMDGCNTFWMFGGWGLGEYYYNDLWRYGSFSTQGAARCNAIWTTGWITSGKITSGELTSGKLTSGEPTTSPIATSSIVTSGMITSGNSIVSTSEYL